jgi:aldose 1-epimerase
LDANGGASMTMGGAVEAPWAGSMAGVPSQMPDHISAAWRGHIMTLPTDEDGTVAKNGTMLAEGAESATMTAMPDGGQVRAVFKAQNFGVRWPSQTEMTVSVLMSARTLELTVVAHNTGDVPEPIGIGWHPRFALLGGSRQQVTLRAPGRMRVELRDRNNGLPTGNLIPVAGTAYDYTQHDGAKLGDNSVDETFVDLHQNLLDSGPTAELIDPANDYGLRLTVLSPTIKALRVEAPADGEYVALTPQFNYPDPFGHEWANEGDTGMVVLQPGQSTQWKVRLELISMTSHAAPL